MTAEVNVAGERLVVRADRSLYWPRTASLVVTDLHFGKADTFRAHGIPVPGGPDAMLRRLTTALAESSAERLIVLGDFWHDRSGVTEDLLQTLTAWRLANHMLSVDLVSGNHDRVMPPSEWGVWRACLDVPPFLMTHYPDPVPNRYVLAGHFHPGVRLVGRGRERVVLPCFRFDDQVGVLPAFGDLTGFDVHPPRRNEQVFAIAESEVFKVSLPR